MKLLFVIPTLKDGGAEKAISNITTHLPDDVEADILINSVSDHDFPTGANIISLGMPVSKNMGILYQMTAMLRRMPKLYKLKRNNHYDACISFLDSANIANILTGNRKCKVIISIRISLKKASKKFYYKYLISPLARLLYNRADRVVAVSEGVRAELSELFGVQKKKLITIENGYDTDVLSDRAKEALDDEDAALNNSKYIITVGRLLDQKGQWHLIRAFAEAAKNTDVYLLILGSGALEEYLKKVASACGIEDRVIFKGFVENPYKYIAGASVFIMPSLYEGFPNAMAEAVCLGIPCIATDFQTGAREILAPELVDNKNEINDIYLAQFGILTPMCSGKQYQGNEELETSEVKLAEAIQMLLEDVKVNRHYSVKSIERSKELRINETVKKWMQLIV